jgi:AcrR family transcriptional regulator
VEYVEEPTYGMHEHTYRMYERQERVESTRRTQAQRAADTRDALIAAARQLFAAHGFADVALETIVRAAGVTRGALYHHFADKTELFAAVFEQVEGELAARMGQAIVAANQTDPVTIMRLGVDFWLDASSDPEVQRIVLVDAPAVLGWARWTEIGNRYNIGFVRDLLAGAIELGRIPPQPVEATALTMLGAMREATLYVARAKDHDQARREAGVVMSRLIQSLSAS